MAREIHYCLLYRDMWQSSGKYMPRVDQLMRVAQPIIDMGCFRRVETNGGGFEQINLLFGENPNRSVREWTQPFNDAGIQTQMLERGLNGIRMSPVPADVRKLMFRVKKLQGTDIARSFDGLNDVRNLEESIQFAQEGGMISQTCLCITHSPIHTVGYYIEMADKLIGLGADEIAIKDMAGIGRPVSLGKIVAGIKADHPHVLVQYHGHSTPGFSVASILEVARAGAEIIDVSMEPLSWGTAHADLLTVQEVLKDAGFKVPSINMDAYMQVRSLTQEFIDDFLGYYINPQNRYMNSLIIGPGLPGGMMGSLMADLENNVRSLNKWLSKRDKPPVSQQDLLLDLFKEVEYIWPKMGYPPLVTPYSQYVKNVALMNVMQMRKGKKRWSMIADNIWDMLMGKAGKLPGPVDPELLQLAQQQQKELYTGTPSEGYPDQLVEFRKEMKQNNWDLGQDEEELLELAMHPQQYRNYKSGKAKADFLADLEERKKQTETPSIQTVPTNTPAPQTMYIQVNGESYTVSVSYDEAGVNNQPSVDSPPVSQPTGSGSPKASEGQQLLSPLEGIFYLTKDNQEIPVKVGDVLKTGDIIGYIEAMKVYNAITVESDGKVQEILPNGTTVEEDEPIARLA